MKRLLKLIVSLGIPFSAAAIGSAVSVQNIPTWYAALEKPVLNPPNFIFGPVWTLLYVLIGLSLYLYWTSEGNGKWSGYVAFGVQMVLNALWSVVFFGLQLPLLGVFVIALLDIMVIVTIILFYEKSKRAAYLLMPYLLWISFATYLTVSIWLLNS
jgi:tryptophan-rich sensory protein